MLRFCRHAALQKGVFFLPHSPPPRGQATLKLGAGGAGQQWTRPRKRSVIFARPGLRTELVSPLSASASWWSVAVVVRCCRPGCPVAVVVAGGRRHLSASSIAKKRQRPQVVGGAWLRRALCCAGSVLCRFGAVLLLCCAGSVLCWFCAVLVLWCKPKPCRALPTPPKPN